MTDIIESEDRSATAIKAGFDKVDRDMASLRIDIVNRDEERRVQIDSRLISLRQVRLILCEKQCILMYAIFEELRDELQLAVTNFGSGRDEYQLAINKGMATFEGYFPLKIEADHVWIIDKLREKTNSTWIWSEYFHVRQERYKMRLWCYWRSNDGKDVNVYLYIYSGEIDAHLQWPFERRVTITVTNQLNPKVHRAITKQCRIEKQPNNEYYSSHPFTFSYSDLYNAGLLLCNYMIVNCVIDNH